MRKRFWETAHVVVEPDGFGVRLDQRPLRLSGGEPLRMRSRPLAEAVALEWRLAGGEKGGLFGTDDLVLNGLASTMQTHVAPFTAETADRLMGFANGELLCYRAEGPAPLVALQQERWQPWLDWLRITHGVELTVVHGIMPAVQPEHAVARLRIALQALSPASLTGLGVVVPALGSLVLGLALAARQVDADEAFRLGRLDEDFQTSLWGVDPEAEAAATRLRIDVTLAVRFMELADG